MSTSLHLVVAGSAIQAGDMVRIGGDSRAYRVTSSRAGEVICMPASRWAWWLARAKVRLWMAWWELRDCWYAAGGDE